MARSPAMPAALLPAWSNVSTPVIGMLHLGALPGSPLYGGSIAAIREAVLRDANLLAEGSVLTRILLGGGGDGAGRGPRPGTEWLLEGEPGVE